MFFLINTTRSILYFTFSIRLRALDKQKLTCGINKFFLTDFQILNFPTFTTNWNIEFFFLGTYYYTHVYHSILFLNSWIYSLRFSCKYLYRYFYVKDAVFIVDKIWNNCKNVKLNRRL